MAIETQGTGSDCPGGCQYGNAANITGLTIKGNFAHNFVAPYGNTYGYSFPIGALQPYIINNTAVMQPNGNPGYGFESGNKNEINQGNVASVNGGSQPWGVYNISGYPGTGYTVTQQNNYFAGTLASGGGYYGPEGTNFGGSFINQYNINASACANPAACDTSMIALAFTSANNQNFAAGGSGTWTIYITDEISIKNVQFFLDGSTSPIVTQELQDLNTNFTSDGKWLYHATFDTTSLANGAHTLQALATDVSGATKSQTQNFTVGSGTSPTASFNPTSLSLGSVSVGSASSPLTVILTNPGTATLNITSILSSGDFSNTTTCTSTLAVSASCNVVVTFSPTAAGTRTGAISVTDNAAGSPQTIALTGTGTSVSTPPACAGILVNCDFNTGTANWSFSAGNSTSSWVVDATGPSGINTAHITATSIPVPLSGNIELYQDNLSYGANGTTYQLTFKANTSRAQQINVLGIQSSSPYTGFGLAYTPTLSTGWHTYTTIFTVTNSPGAGMGRVTIQMDNAASGDQIDLTDFSLASVGSSSSLTINSVGYITHSTVQIVVTPASSFYNGTNPVARTRSTIIPATCTGGTGGLVQPMEIGPTYLAHSGAVLNMDVAGLTANTTYNICPEISADGGTTWSSGVGVTVTTLPLPAIHPAAPIPPATFDASYPDTTGFATYTVASDCSDIGAAYTAAAARQATQGTVIYIPAGTVCGTSNTGNFDFAIKPVDVQTWHPSNVTVASGQIQLGGAPTLTEGQGIRFGRSYVALTSYPASTSCEFGQGLVTGQVYYVHVIDSSTNTVTLECNDGITPMVFTSQGTDSSQGFYWVPANRTLKPIIVRSAAPDSQLPPPGVDITPAWQSKMGIIQSAIGNLGVLGPGGAVISMGSNDGNYELMISNIRIGPGIEITTVDSPEAHTSSDPTPWYTFVYTFPFDDNIVFDRVYFHPLGAPNRVNDGLYWDGFNNAIINSYFDNIEYFHAEYSGLTAAETSSNAFTVDSGMENMGSGNVTVAGPRTVTLSGTGTGRVFVGLDMANSNAFTVWLPSGLTATCSGFSCASATATGTTNGSCNASDSWPIDSSGNPSVGQIACIDVSAGAITAVTNANAAFSTHWGEGAQWMIGGLGPGPYVFQGNFSSCAGLCWHHDDSGGTQHLRGDYTYYRNYFETPFKYMYNPNNLAANPASDGLGRYHRQPSEWKGGRRIRYEGNVCDGNWVEVEASAGCVLLTSVNGMGISDVDIQNNTFMHGPGVTSFCFVTAGSNFPMPPACQRFRMRNNLAWDIGNPNYYAGTQALPPPGWIGEGPNATEDLIMDHNTIVGNIGTNPAVMWPFDLNTEGVSVTNNIFYINSTNQGLAQDGGEPNFAGCPLLTGKALADCKFTPSYVWQNNLMIGNGQTPAAVAAAWPSLANYFQSGSSSLSGVGWFNYQTPAMTNGNPAFLDYHLRAASPWSAGSSGVNDHTGAVGADIDMLNAAQGLVTLGGVAANTITASSAAVAYVAPDSGSCYVDYSAGDPAVMTSPSRVKDAGGPRPRSVALTGLSSQTTYYYRVMCSGNYKISQRTGQFRTN
jgi:hypothetical protein